MVVRLVGKRGQETYPGENKEAEQSPKHKVTYVSSRELQGVVIRTIQKMAEYNTVFKPYNPAILFRSS